MKGMEWNLLRGIFLTVAIVVIGLILVGPVAGFDVKKYFGLQPILGEPGEIIGNPVLTQIQNYEIIGRNGKILGKWKLDITMMDPTDCWGDDKRFCKFESQSCGDDTAVACKTFTQPDTDPEKYDGDALTGIYIENNKCVVTTFDIWPGGRLQKRAVGVFCAKIKSTDVEYNWGDWSGNDEVTGGSCPAGKTPFFCMTKIDDSLVEYSDDVFVSLYKDPASSGCKALAIDPDSVFGVGGTGKSREVGVVCVPDSTFTDADLNLKWYSTEHFDEETANFDMHTVVGKRENRAGHLHTYRNVCPGDSQLVSFTTEYNRKDSGQRDQWLIDLNTYAEKKSGVASGDYLSMLEVRDAIGNLINPRYFSLLCAERLWYWSDWKLSTDTNPVVESPSCPAGQRAIACASDTSSLEFKFGNDGGTGTFCWGIDVFLDNGGGRYGEDAINSIYISDDKTKCIVASKDLNGGSEHKRRVGVLCAKQESFPDASYKETDWYSIDAGSVRTTKYSSPDCDAGYSPVFCTVKQDISDSEYGEDYIVSLVSDGTKCNVELGDQGSPYKFKFKVGAVCAPSDKVSTTMDANWQQSTFEDPFFISKSYCPPGKIAICMTQSDVRDSEKGGDDPIIAIEPTFDPETSNSYCSVEAFDLVRGGIGSACPDNEHTRKLGVICLSS